MSGPASNSVLEFEHLAGSSQKARSQTGEGSRVGCYKPVKKMLGSSAACYNGQNCFAPGTQCASTDIGSLHSFLYREQIG
ncbi:hypothetical protein Tco_0064405 [Tanacetum coccineum]